MKVTEPAAFHHLNISRSGLSAQRRRMDAISENLANLNTTRGVDGGPFQPRVVVLREGEEERDFLSPDGQRPSGLWTTHPEHMRGSRPGGEGDGLAGVQAERFIQNRRPRMEYDPEHPDADADGYVAYPDINVVEEMTHLIAASRAYEANLTAITAAKDMAAKALEI
ncbi:MAG: flagellar basal body rod protein FlgC [bacterium]|jgi:flagellar basal-body rod protein FlgC|nr:flagellar basal body rod protein FlgC [bacterium]